jgi:glycosyltransferase involved in cell wall biosynthesis
VSELTIVIPFYNGHQHIERLINSIPSGIPVIIVDDCSDKPLAIDDPNFRVIRLKSKGYFAGAVNVGMESCSTDVLILNQDVWFESSSWLETIFENRSKYALIGEKIDGFNDAYPKGYIHGTFMFIRRDAIRSVGLLDDVHYPLWGSTAEWQLRARRKNYEALMLSEIPGMKHARGESKYGDAIKRVLKLEPEKERLFLQVPPIISVVIPCYNYGRYLPDLVASMIGGNSSLGHMRGQTFNSFELVIVDDCSTDNTPDIGRALADSSKGIRYFRTPINGGTAYAMNYGISKSNGEIITMLGADDMRESNSLELMYKTLMANPHSFVYDHVRIFADGKRDQNIWTMPEFDFPKLLYKNHVHCGIMYTYTAWKEAGGYPEIMRDGREDWAFNVALGSKGYCGVLVDNPGYLYRREGQNRTLTNTTPTWHDIFLKRIQQTFPHLYKGDLPMGCCGSSRKVASTAGAKSSTVSAKTTSLAGQDGMVILEYQGANYGTTRYYGPATGVYYTFSASKRRKLVDVRDLYYNAGNGRAVGLLDLVDHGAYLFKEVKQASITPDEPVAYKADADLQIVEEEVFMARSEEVVQEESEKKSDLYNIGLDDEAVEYLIDNGIEDIQAVESLTAKELRIKLEWTVSDVKLLREQIKKYQSDLE